jgi:protein-S-isoprenylcysteine O-methyltransferase Ste14
VTNFLRRILGEKYRFYRLFFNAFSVAALIPLLGYAHSAHFGTELLVTWDGMRITQYGLIALAATLVLISLRGYRVLQFMGIEQILARKPGEPMTEKGELLTTGVLGLIRHPWYLAVFILLWAGDLNLADLTVNTVLSVYLVIGTFLEERKLVIEFGDKYRLYQRQVSMFIPLKWLRSRLSSDALLKRNFFHQT